MIAAAVLGVVALAALFMAFGPSFGGSATTASVQVTATPRPGVPPVANRPDLALPTAEDQTFYRETTPIAYTPGRSYAPDPGRNIFAFYEPPPPCPDCPTPTPKPVFIPPPTPAPTPEFWIAGLSPPNLFAGSPGFRLQVSGDRFTPDSRIYFNQNELPTVYVSPQTLAADIPANFITQEGPRQIIIQTPDGQKYSNQMMLTVLAPPKPTFQYIGMIGRKRYNNDTAYFTDPGRPTPFSARLNDVVAGRFRLVDMSPVEVVFEDTSLGFRHRVAISKASTTGSGTGPGPRGFPSSDGFVPFNPGEVPSGNIPGIPSNVQRVPVRPQPPQPQPRPPQRQPESKEKKDVDDDGDG